MMTHSVWQTTLPAGRLFTFQNMANLILAAYLTLPVLWSSFYDSLEDVYNKDPREVNRGDLIAETAVIPCIVLFPGGIPHMKGVGMLVGNFELNP